MQILSHPSAEWVSNTSKPYPVTPVRTAGFCKMKHTFFKPLWLCMFLVMFLVQKRKYCIGTLRVVYLWSVVSQTLDGLMCGLAGFLFLVFLFSVLTFHSGAICDLHWLILKFMPYTMPYTERSAHAITIKNPAQPVKHSAGMARRRRLATAIRYFNPPFPGHHAHVLPRRTEGPGGCCASNISRKYGTGYPTSPSS